MVGGAKKKILSNSVWMIIQHLYSMLTSLTVVALIARYLGPSDYGLINYCASVISIFTTLAGLGLDNLLVSEIIRNPGKEGGYLGTALVMRLITSFVSYPLFLGVIALLHPGDKVLFIVAVLQGLGMIFQTYDVLVYWFRIKLKMKFISIAMVCAITVTSIIRIVMLYLKVSVEWFALAISIQALAAALIITAVFIKKSDVKLTVSMADAKALLKISYNCIISSMSIIIYMQADKIILSWATFFAMSGYVRSIWITGEGFYRFDKIFTVTAALLDIVLDILFIWQFGIVGAALATLVTYIYEVLIVPLFFKQTRIFTKLYFQSFKLIPRFSLETIKGIFKKSAK